MQDLRRIHYVTTNFSALQGLKLVPFGLLFLLFAAQDAGWSGLGSQGNCTLTLPLLLVVIALYFVISRYYAGTFGRVQRASGAEDLVMLIWVAALFGAIVVEITLKPPVSLIGLVMGIGFVGEGFRSKRWHYVVLGGLMGGVSLLPLWLNGPVIGKHLGSFGFMFDLALGLTYLVGGLLDHYLLLHGLKPAPEAKDAQPL